jgi:crotonobetainyl-CoA:carnitine CoA-transferase CaiB-like acyl-CoA transferase
VSDQALAGLRVLELGNLVAVPYASKLMADLGAEVIKIEPPGLGDETRRRGPYPGGKADPEQSGLFLYLNSNKRGVTLDTSQARGRELLRALLRDADVLLHDLPRRDIEAHGVAFDELAALNPRLVVTSITPFGLSGPHADYAATDLVAWSAGGVTALNGGGPGTDEMPPLKAFGSQAGFQGGVNAALATLGAIFERLSSGAGQQVEVSIQECVASILELTFEYWPYMGLVATRLGHKPIQPLDFIECADGWIFLCCVEEHQWHKWVELMDNPEWATLELFENRLMRGQNWDALKIFLSEWCADKKVDELYHRAQARRIPIAPVSTMGDLLTSKHLASRGFFATLASPAGDIVAPGAPYRFSRTPWKLKRPAPLLGEHNQEIFGGQLGRTPAELDALRDEKVI